MTNRKLILGTRSSRMALAMAEAARAQLQAAHAGMEVELRGFSSAGDLYQGDLSRLGGKGVFVKDLEMRLLRGEIDCAIHALKDVPGDVDPHPELQFVSFMTREDPRDALVLNPSLSLSDLARPLTLATSSPRRQAILRRLYPLAGIVPLRGNVDTRLQKLLRGGFDGMVVSYSGLKYLGLTHYASKIFEPEEMLPAVGQGVLCLQVRKADIARCSHLSALNDADTLHAVTAERRLLAALKGNCHSAIAGYCRAEGRGLYMNGWVAAPDGSTLIRAAHAVADTSSAEALGSMIGDSLIAQGALELIPSLAV